MPWINQDKCTGCGVCVEGCPVNAISLNRGKAIIDMEKCIRCGRCHDICSREAIIHDSERIPFEVEKNVKKTKELIRGFKDKKEKQTFLGRMIKHYNKEIKIAKEVIEKIKQIEI